MDVGAHYLQSTKLSFVSPKRDAVAAFGVDKPGTVLFRAFLASVVLMRSTTTIAIPSNTIGALLLADIRMRLLR